VLFSFSFLQNKHIDYSAWVSFKNNKGLIDYFLLRHRYMAVSIHVFLMVGRVQLLEGGWCFFGGECKRWRNRLH